MAPHLGVCYPKQYLWYTGSLITTTHHVMGCITQIAVSDPRTVVHANDNVILLMSIIPAKIFTVIRHDPCAICCSDNTHSSFPVSTERSVVHKFIHFVFKRHILRVVRVVVSAISSLIEQLTDSLTDWPTELPNARSIHRTTDWLTDGRTDGRTGLAVRLNNELIDLLTDCLVGWLSDWLTNWLTDKNKDTSSR